MTQLYGGPWGWGRFLRYLAPSIMTMVFIAFYAFVDGIFIARFVGGDALAALNIAFPFMSFVFGVTIMPAVGGATLISIRLGEGDRAAADRGFSLILVVILVLSLILTAAAAWFSAPLVEVLGATPRLRPYCLRYLRTFLVFVPFFMQKIAFEYLLRADGAPHRAFVCSLIGGIGNIVFDYLFIVVAGWGMAGAALGTGLGALLGFVFSVTHFFGKKAHLKFRRPQWEPAFLRHAFINGSSEMVNEWSGGITTFLFNYFALRYLGEAGVSAVSALLLMNFVMLSLLFGTGMGFSPVASYFYGSGDEVQRRSLQRMSLILMLLFSVASALTLFFGSGLLARLFDREGDAFAPLLQQAFRLFSCGFLFSGFNLFTGNLFTALNCGRRSALVALMRSLVGVVLGLSLLPRFFGVAGIWMAVPAAELMTLFVSAGLLAGERRKRLRCSGEVSFFGRNL